VLVLLSISAAWAAPVEARDWTPQITATRRAQLYWEERMRTADKTLHRLKKTKKQTVRKLKRIERKLEKAGNKRVAAKKRLKVAKTELATARKPQAPPVSEILPPDAMVAVEALFSPLRLAALAAAPMLASSLSAAQGPEMAVSDAASPQVVDAGATRKLARSVKQAKRSYKIGKRKARRSQRNWRMVKSRMRSLKATERTTRATREQAERSLGSSILAMTRFGRIRAVKKSDARPGVSSRFAWPVVGSLSQRYHAGHDGIDIVRYKGAPVRAMAFGVVTYVGWNPWDQHGRAFMVVVTHAGGYETLYGHLEPKRVVRVGEEVKKGHVIGYMGNTGNSTGPHLHLELRRGRTTLDPLSFL
jgi:murein DD-endopeptidase MepM/ murein hydrolase activator NlpD